MSTIYLAAGCFWGVQAVFNLLDAVIETKVGYCGGHTTNPTYEEVCSKATGHAEAVEVVFDSSKVTVNQILNLYFHIHDFEQENGQGNDIGPQYRSAIFLIGEQKKFEKEITSYLKNLKDEKPKLTTEFKVINQFYNAEDYHQHYLAKNPTGYCHINMHNVALFLKKNNYKLKE